METEIYYFSGTGNSLFVAKKLQELLPDSELIPIVKRIEENNYDIKGKNAGFVFPCHGLTIPIPVRDFLKRIEAASVAYFFVIATRGGTVFKGFEVIEDYLKRQGKHLNAAFAINMGLNDPKLGYFAIPTKDELDTIEKNALKKLEEIQKIILTREEYQDKTGVSFSNNKLLNYILERLIPFMTHFISPLVKKYFYADPKCTGCGICENVCLSGKVKMAGSRPVWQSNVKCYLCYSCLNYCPSEAVQIYSKIWMKSYTAEKGRYPHPHATAIDISKQKNL
ncbi:MAG TPA: EFR1 family ferrodoxin [Candidatus Humimicrobiaceae bacterium]|nr:EFR1 family ferrodoxin [Candidatus Humimicrobiaceae bacterium]